MVQEEGESTRGAGKNYRIYTRFTAFIKSRPPFPQATRVNAPAVLKFF